MTDYETVTTNWIKDLIRAGRQDRKTIEFYKSQVNFLTQMLKEAQDELKGLREAPSNS